MVGALAATGARSMYSSTGQLAVVPIEDPTHPGNSLEGAAAALPMLAAVMQTGPAADQVVEALGLAKYFVHVYGGNSFPTKKPDPLGARTLLEQTRTRAEEALMIGDSSIDVITGRNAELWTCGVTYGFVPRTLDDAPPDVLVDAPRELAEVFG